MDNFERCLAITLKWEGGYSNHPDDPGGPTMRGIIQREYDVWRHWHGQKPRPVRQIEEGELRAIYHANYWDAMNCGSLASGYDLCVFDAAVNSGVARARRWHEAAQGNIDSFCNERIAFLRGLGRLWRVFGRGWGERVAGIRAEAHEMAGHAVPSTLSPSDDTLHAGMRGDAVRDLQRRLRALGYPVGDVDGIFGQQTYRAVSLFQDEHDLGGERGVWQASYQATLDAAEPLLPDRRDATHRDLEAAGDRPIQRLNFLQRMFAWMFGASAANQIFDGSSALDSVSGWRDALQPMQSVFNWASSNRWLLLCAVFVAAIAIIRLIRADHVNAYRYNDYQGPYSQDDSGTAKGAA